MSKKSTRQPNLLSTCEIIVNPETKEFYRDGSIAYRRNMRQGAQLAGLPYAGVPEESIDKLGTKSMQLAARQVLRSRRATRRRKNRMQQAKKQVAAKIAAQHFFGESE